MRSVRTLLRSKSPRVWYVAPDATVYRALEIMAEKNVGALPVVDGDAILGMFSERDYARGIVLAGKSSRDTPVRELMRSPVLYVRPEQSIDDCMALMTEKRVRHLPVVEGGALTGIVSIGDVVRAIIADQGYEIEQLENYIKGAP